MVVELAMQSVPVTTEVVCSILPYKSVLDTSLCDESNW